MDFYGTGFSDLERYFEEKGDNKAKAKILYKNLYRNKISAENITELSEKTISGIISDFSFELPSEIDKRDDGETVKSLLRLADGSGIETVLMRHSYGAGLCVSTQVGCLMDCKFCQSGKLKKRRNLTAAEMTSQVVYMSRFDEIKHVSIMGIGEPLDNFDNLKTFMEIISNPYGFGFGGKNITLSTCGLVPQINRLHEINCNFNLAISLHAPNDRLRDFLMPINKTYNLNLLINSVKNYSEKYNKRVAFEYVLIDSVNDSTKCADETAELLKGINCYVNLIPYNSTCSDFKRSNNADEFFDRLKKNGLNVIFRREFGSGINAACGQLCAENANCD